MKELLAIGVVLLVAACASEDAGPPFMVTERDSAGVTIVENRIDTGLQALSFHVGAVVFFDVGWVHDSVQGFSQGERMKGKAFSQCRCFSYISSPMASFRSFRTFDIRDFHRIPKSTNINKNIIKWL